MRVKIENFPKIYDAYKKLRGIREEDIGDNGITYTLPMHGVTREDVDWMVLRNVLLISASRKDSFEHYYQIPLPNGCTKNDVQLSEDFKLGQLLVWIAKEPGGIRVPLHAGKSLNQHSPSMPLSAASAGPVNLTTYCYEHGRKFEILDEVPTIDVHGSPGKSSYAFADLPKEVVMTLVQGSMVTCLEFHPQHQNLLLVGTNSGEIAIWDFGSRDKLVQKDFKVSNLGACSGSLQATLANDYTASINHVTWSPDGKLLGVASSKNVVQIYSYHGGDDMRKHLEIEAHAGSVNDLAFSYPNNKLSIVTCGDDKLIRVWDAVTGAKEFELKGHDAPVYSVCPHFKIDIQFILSTDINGKIKGWLYDNSGSKADLSAPGASRIAFSDDGKRVFSCGTNKEGEPFIVEWKENEGGVRHNYKGLGKHASGVLQFDTVKNRYIAAGDKGSVKFWDMDNARMLAFVNLEPGSPTSSFLRFNKNGMLIAVATQDRIKILANPDGVKLLSTMNNHSFNASSAAKASAMTAFVTASASGRPSTVLLMDTHMVRSGSSVGTDSGFGPSSTTLGATNSAKYGVSAGHESGAGPSTTTVGDANATDHSHR